MKTRIIFCLTVSLFLMVQGFAQQEKPEKILSYSSPQKLESYMTGKGWKLMGAMDDSTSGTYYLYRTSTASKGYAYLAIYLQKFMHYQVFYVDKRPYSPVLTFEDFLKMPQGDSEYNRSIENKTFNIKSIELNDPSDTRNINMFYGKVDSQKSESGAPENSGDTGE